MSRINVVVEKALIPNIKRSAKYFAPRRGRHSQTEFGNEERRASRPAFPNRVWERGRI